MSYYSYGELEGRSTVTMDAGITINNAISALGGNGGVVDMRSTLTGAQTISTTVHIPAHVTVLLGAATFTSTVTAFSLEGEDAQLIGLGAGNSGADEGTPVTAATSIIGSGLGSGVDLLVVAILTASRTSIAASRINRPLVANLHLDCGGSGRDAIRVISSWFGKYENITARGFVSDGFHLMGDISTTFEAASYRNVFERIQVNATSVTTGSPFHLDGSLAEIAYNTFVSCHGESNVGTDAGSDSFYLHAGPSTNASASIDHCQFFSCHAQNPSSGKYGFRLEAQGTASAQTGGRIFDLAFINCEAEHIGTGMSGVGIGGTSNGSPSGTGIIAIQLVNFDAGGFTTAVDYANLGTQYVANDNTDPSAVIPFFLGGGILARGPIEALSASGDSVSVSAADTASDTRAVILPFSNAGGIEATNASLSAPKPLVINPFGGSVTVNNTTPSTKYNLEVNGSIGIDGATPTGSGSSLGLGNTTGFGNGSSGVTVTTNAKGTGTGPTTPQRVVKYLEVDIGGVKFWIPLVQ